MGIISRLPNRTCISFLQLYQKEQTLTQGERFFTELKEQEANFLGATEGLQELEYQLFLEILDQAQAVAESAKNAQLMAQIDCLASFAETAARYNYVRPESTIQEL